MKRHRVLKLVALIVLVLGGVAFFVVRSIMAGGGDTSEIPIDEVVRRYQASTSTAIPVPAIVGTTAVATAAPPAATAAATSPATTPATMATTATTDAVPPVMATTTTTPAKIPAFPEPGVYVYATTGTDSIDVLGGVHHDYPATTTITVIPTDCGVLQRWDVVAERWQEWQRCAVSGGVMEPGRVNYDEFFDLGQKDTYVCTGDPRPLDAPAGTTWLGTCRKDDHEDIHTGTVIGVEQVDVGGTLVDALHVRTEIDNGRESDRQTTDTWYQLGTDLLLVRSASNHTTNDTAFGVVHYVEEYEIRLTSLDHLG